MSDWHGLYRDSWNGEIVPEAFGHPAKFAPGLIRHIYDHAAAEGWLKPGDSVVDPFGGVALGGLHAMRHGLHWTGCELEPRFVELAEQNIALWNRKYGRMPRWGTARIVQGDSRRLTQVIGATVGATISSPPYAELGSGVKSGKVDESKWTTGQIGRKMGLSQNAEGYGSTPGNLGNLPARAGDFAAAVGSPPFAESIGQKEGGTGCLDPKNAEKYDSRTCGMGRWKRTQDDYGTSPGQLGAMKAGDPSALLRVGVAGCVSSPPFENSIPQQDKVFVAPHDSTGNLKGEYGSSDGQLGQSTGDTFWSASRTILEQVHAVLRPGGHAIWVLKAFVKNKAIVDFPGQWQALCESVGFRTVHVHRAWLVEDHGTQLAHDGNHKRHRTERKSFFRRLAESKGSPRIDFEIVLCTERVMS